MQTATAITTTAPARRHIARTNPVAGARECAAILQLRHGRARALTMARASYEKAADENDAGLSAFWLATCDALAGV